MNKDVQPLGTLLWQVLYRSWEQGETIVWSATAGVRGNAGSSGATNGGCSDAGSCEAIAGWRSNAGSHEWLEMFSDGKLKVK